MATQMGWIPQNHYKLHADIDLEYQTHYIAVPHAAERICRIIPSRILYVTIKENFMNTSYHIQPVGFLRIGLARF